MKAFRTIEISDADGAGLRYVTVKSAALGARADMTVFAPREAIARHDVPLVILLHGVYGSHWAWAHQGRAHETLQRLVTVGDVPPMALAMPSDGLWGDGSGYLRHPTQDFESWIVNEVPIATAMALPCVSASSKHFVSGLSMGGFGALRLGAKYPHRFAGASGHSSITEFEQLKLFIEEDLASYGAPAEDRSVLETILRNRDRLPPLRFDCGASDLLIEQNRALHRMLNEERVRHVYEEFPGAHEWPYWRKHVEETFRFFGKLCSAQS
ncbi:MAG TPA: alpha/beta hydrolase-fold protein [Candidatus Acidoferrum sp.]|nr:alpha/beta hydrolase-fold protein [Candidatus Acidoferrum sp.]